MRVHCVFLLLICFNGRRLVLLYPLYFSLYNTVNLSWTVLSVVCFLVLYQEFIRDTFCKATLWTCQYFCFLSKRDIKTVIQRIRFTVACQSKCIQCTICWVRENGLNVWNCNIFSHCVYSILLEWMDMYVMMGRVWFCKGWGFLFTYKRKICEMVCSAFSFIIKFQLQNYSRVDLCPLHSTGLKPSPRLI